MTDDTFQIVIRTPHGAVFDKQVRAARVSTETGQVGLRPRGESLVLAIEPGLVVLRLTGETRFVATAGGLLSYDGHQCVLYTPFAATGNTAAEVLEALEQALSTQDSELAARQKLNQLEKHILRELRDRSSQPGHRLGSKS